jgi:hypothetical protein
MSKVETREKSLGVQSGTKEVNAVTHFIMMLVVLFY